MEYYRKNQRVYKTICLPEMLWKQLLQQANKRGITLNGLIVIILQNYVRSCIVQEYIQFGVR